MLDRSQYSKYMTPSPLDYSSMGNFGSGLVNEMSDGASFLKRPDALSAGIPSWGDTMQGYGQDAKGAVGGMFDGFFGGKDAATGAKTTGWGMDFIGAGAGLLTALGSWKAGRRADEAFKYQKMVTDKNMANQTASYNTNLTNKAQDAQSGTQNIDDYLNKNRLA